MEIRMFLGSESASVFFLIPIYTSQPFSVL